MFKQRQLCAFVLLLGSWLLVARAASSQALPAASGPGAYVSVGGGVSAYQVDYGKRIDYGSAAFANLHLRGRYSLEAEARFLKYHTDEQVTQTTYLIGPELVLFKHGPFRPYAKFLVGDARMTFPFGYAHGNYFAMAPGGGVDIAIAPRLDLRLFDVEYQSWPQFTYGNLHPFGVTAGIRVRLTRPNIYRKDPYVFE